MTQRQQLPGMLRTFAFLIAALVLPVAGQSEERLLNVRTLCFSYIDDVKSVFVPGERKGEMLEQELYTAVYSLPFQMRATGGKGVFFLPNDDPEKPYKALPAVELPATSEILFLFLPSPDKAKSPYRIVALPDDTRSFPYGSVRLMNLSNHNVRIHMGEHSGGKAVNLTPGKSRLVDSVRKVDGLNRYPVLSEYETDKGFARFHNTAWRSIKDKRDLAIIYTEPKSGHPRIKHYEDAAPADLGSGDPG
ncbi:hypothetical protein Hhel01_01368 [Haloferula helveola]